MKNARPKHNPKAKTVTVIENPFDAEAKKYIELFSQCPKEEPGNQNKNHTSNTHEKAFVYE